MSVPATPQPDIERAAYCSATNRVIDLLRPGEPPEAAIRRLAGYSSALVILPFKEALARHEAAYRTEPVEIDEAAWHEALNMLPPDGAFSGEVEAGSPTENATRHEAGAPARYHRTIRRSAWQNTACGESFKCAERITGAITAIYVRINDRHFRFDDSVTMPHADCCATVIVSPAFRHCDRDPR